MPHRTYHNAAHVAEVLRWFDVVADEAGWHAAASVYLAIVFHDAVYDPARTDNEARSAELARALGGTTDRTTELILLTARHGAIDAGAVDADAGHFLDCDTAILGAPPDEFDAYDAAIAAEYRHVPIAAFRAGRHRFFGRLLGRPRIFLTAVPRSPRERSAGEPRARASGEWRDVLLVPHQRTHDGSGPRRGSSAFRSSGFLDNLTWAETSLEIESRLDVT